MRSIKPDIEYLHEVHEGDLAVTARTLDDSRWIVAFISDNGPVRYYIYDRNARAAQSLFSANSHQEHLPLSRMNYTTIKSRDGLDLVSYYTLPVGPIKTWMAYLKSRFLWFFSSTAARGTGTCGDLMRHISFCPTVDMQYSVSTSEGQRASERTLQMRAMGNGAERCSTISWMPSTGR